MRRRRAVLVILVILLVLFVVAVAVRRSRRDGSEAPTLSPGATAETPQATAAPTPEGPVASISTIIKDGGRMDWSHALDLIAFDRKGDDGSYDVWTMRPDGSDQVCVTCETPGLPQGHSGQPAWSPTGEWIVFQTEKPEHPGGSVKARPGLGVDNDVWVVTRDGQQAFQLTDTPLESAMLHPHFSPDGSQVLWAERLQRPSGGQPIGGEWAMKLADFVADGGGRLANVQTLQPNGPVFYETHGFTNDGSRILYTSTPEGGTPVTGLDIYTLDLSSGELVNLTASPDEWDEHAHYSPSENKIVWMSSLDCGCNPHNLGDLKTDLWLMDADGSNKVRLTHFSDPDFPERQGRTVIAGDTAWSPDGKRVITRLIVDRSLLQLLNLLPEIEPMIMVEFSEPQ